MLKAKLGFKGERGYSAYEIAVKHGYTGTEEEWSEDFLNAENYYDKTEADALINSKKNAGDFVTLTGTVTEPTLLGVTLQYPEGFTSLNCTVIGYDVKYDETAFWNTFQAVSNSGNLSNGLIVRLFNDKIQLYNAEAFLIEKGYDYRVTLMKIPSILDDSSFVDELNQNISELG